MPVVKIISYIPDNEDQAPAAPCACDAGCHSSRTLYRATSWSKSQRSDKRHHWITNTLDHDTLTRIFLEAWIFLTFVNIVMHYHLSGRFAMLCCVRGRPAPTAHASTMRETARREIAGKYNTNSLHSMAMPQLCPQIYNSKVSTKYNHTQNSISFYVFGHSIRMQIVPMVKLNRDSKRNLSNMY